mmetsp:Transcript_23779/g.45314  ORF Transcript_23779/g.45314 Transcript_23779/m.45314 type:complete len:207 (-) Transcript_23779:454-1074(-)
MNGEGWVGSVAVPAFSPLSEKFAVGGLSSVPTREFVLACAELVAVFDRLGVTFQIASQDVAEKKTNLLKEDVLSASPFVQDLITNDEKEDKVCVPEQSSRMLHCLKRMLVFVAALMQKLVADRSLSLYTCAAEAYSETLEKYHSTAVKLVIKGGLWFLPNRSNFLKAINETEDSAEASMAKFIPMINPMIDELERAFAPWENRCLK